MAKPKPTTSATPSKPVVTRPTPSKPTVFKGTGTPKKGK